MISLLTVLEDENNWYDWCWELTWRHKVSGILYKTAATQPDYRIVILFRVMDGNKPTCSSRGLISELKRDFDIID